MYNVTRARELNLYIPSTVRVKISRDNSEKTLKKNTELVIGDRFTVVSIGTVETARVYPYAESNTF